MPSDKAYIWDFFRNASPDIQKQTLDKLTASLPDMNPREQVDSFRGAPSEVILQFFPSLERDVQLKIWNEVLPVGARVKARPMLKPDPKEEKKLRDRMEKIKSYLC